jgi:hypothetical protein
MPYGKGTYGSKVGRPPAKKKATSEGGAKKKAPPKTGAAKNMTDAQLAAIGRAYFKKTGQTIVKPLPAKKKTGPNIVKNLPAKKGAKRTYRKMKN